MKKMSVPASIAWSIPLTCALNEAPKDQKIYHEIAVVYNQQLPEHFNKLTPQERVFIYYMYRASLPGNIIATDQTHRHAVAIRQALEFILDNQQELKSNPAMKGIDVAQFIDNITLYLIYHWTNHGHYFIREKQNEKRTPQILGLTQFTAENLERALKSLAFPNTHEVIKFSDSLFDFSHEPTLTVPDSIEKSAVNFYSPDFTIADYETLPAHAKMKINAYFDIATENGNRMARMHELKVGGKYDAELRAAVYWLEKALAHTRQFPETFDAHIVKSLEDLIAYLNNGDEELFKQHSVSWLKSKNRVDYAYGFIEHYEDPKSARAIFQADVTIQTVAMDKLNAILPMLEKRLPVDPQFMRDNLGNGASLPNASINLKAFGAGRLGPLEYTAAYCLPNYNEIRSTHGSKQIIYPKREAIVLNKELSRKLFNSKKHYDFFVKHDPEFELMSAIHMVETILHETLGHGSGKLGTHVFKEGDQMTIGGKTYAIGDQIAVTSENEKEFLAGYDSAMEELRAEIMALATLIECYDELAASGFLKDWPQKIDKPTMIELSLLLMMRNGLMRLLSQPDDATQVSGDHARANMTIMTYCMEHGGVIMSEEEVQIDGKKHTALDIEIVDVQKTIVAVKTLAAEVQRIKSTGDGQAIAILINTYGKPIPNLRHFAILKQNKKTVSGDIKAVVTLNPLYQPVLDAQGNVVDVGGEWPRDVIHQFTVQRELTYATK